MNKEQYEKAVEILKALIQGNDPDTGDHIPVDSVINKANVLRAMVVAVSALQQVAQREVRRSQLPGNVGKSWTKEEEATVAAAFKAGDKLSAIAKRHDRTPRSIESRLYKLGLMTMNNAYAQKPTTAGSKK